MKKLLVSALLVCAFTLLGAPASMASDLDTFLQPRCGVGDPEKTPAQIVAEYGDEIYSRAIGYSVLDVTAENEILMWYLGAMRTPEARMLAADIITRGQPEFGRHVMGAISYNPDWLGMRTVALGALSMTNDEMSRDSASSILADTDYSVLSASRASGIGQAKTELVNALRTLVAQETNPRLRGNFQTALAKLQALGLGS